MSQNFFKIIPTPLGELIVISDQNNLKLVEFNDHKNILNKISSFKKDLIEQTSDPINNFISEINLYFQGKLKKFHTPISLVGSDFKIKVWEELCKIPYGETISYKQQSINLNAPKSFRAVANANGKNNFVIIVPCHRVISSNGSLGGYSSGIERKQALITLERNFSS